MDADPAIRAYETTRDLAIIKDRLCSPLAPDVFGGSFVEIASDERKRVELASTALDRALARWREAWIAE